MISVAALRMQQFGVQFYQASLTAKDIDKLVRFEVLSYGEQAGARRARQQRASPRSGGICSSDASRRARRPISARSSARRSTSSSPTTSSAARRAICRRFAGAVIISCDEPLKFEPLDGEPTLGILKVPEREGILRAIDGQHRLLALHAGMEQFGDETFTRAGGDLRSAAGRSRRADVRHDQREAHAPERVASRVAVRPSAVSRRESRRRARRRARAEREAKTRRSTARSSCSASATGASRRRRSRRN